MDSIATVLVILVAFIHAYIVVLEMVLWQTPRGRKAFGTTPETAATMATLAANQGLYNGFLAAGLAISLFLPQPSGFHFQVFLLGCIVVAGIYGGLTVSRRILVVQASPAALALIAVCSPTCPDRLDGRHAGRQPSGSASTRNRAVIEPRQDARS